MIDLKILELLNAPTKAERLENLGKVLETADFPPMVDEYINNHIHSTYSFSPYSPTAAVYASRAEGLCTAGIIDHDSIAGAEEFLEAGKLVGIPVTIGMECRVSMEGTPFAEKRTNNPDQSGVTYMTIQGVPHDKIAYMNDWFAPYRAKRNERTAKMVANINKLLPDVALDFESDVVPLSQFADGGGITERHLMYALAIKLVDKVGKGQAMVDFMPTIGIKLNPKQTAMMLDLEYGFYEYDLLGFLKSTFVPQVYVKATEECPKLADVVALCKEVGAVLCYAYLGDVAESVTGDKKAQTFEDAYLDELFDCLKACGVPAITYMPTRNTADQLARVRGLCNKLGFFQVSGEDINSPRQGFIIEAMKNPLFANLIDATWQLIDWETGKKDFPFYK
ncbi:MAG: PHP domain-containing protein [Eubacteriales bacterium]